MTTESRRVDDPSRLGRGPCPRCGRRLEGRYKYCPNCAYRLRPELTPPVPPPIPRLGVGSRLVALGGYLAFASMLLLVVYAGFRLFATPEPPARGDSRVLVTRDAGCLPLTLESFRRVEAAYAYRGKYAPGDTSPARAVTRAARDLESLDLAKEALATLREAAATPEETAQALERLREALAPYPGGVEQAVTAWAQARFTPAPSDQQYGLPDAERVDDPYRMSVHEVSNDQYFAFLQAWARRSGTPVPPYLVPEHWQRRTGRREVRRIYDAGQGDHPIRGIPFDAALEFCGWFWEEALDSDPDLVVDLPTWLEYLLAARGEQLDYNYPWGRYADPPPDDVNLRAGETWRIDRGGEYGGFRHLVGNVREWVHGPLPAGRFWRAPDESEEYDKWFPPPIAAGWSYEHGPIEGETPFSADALQYVTAARDLRDVGFRLVIRRAPALPSFVRVEAGPVKHRPPPAGLLPPEQTRFPQGALEPETARAKPIRFAEPSDAVPAPFEMAVTETTNRQYLHFLAAQPAAALPDLVPLTWWHVNRLFRKADPDDERPLDRVFLGYYPAPDRLTWLYPPGQENVPVQGVTVPQAEAYARWLSQRVGRPCALPTVAQYLRAGRGEGTRPYPWGDDPKKVELHARGRADWEARPFSLLELVGDPPERPVGLVGNVAELVRDEKQERLLLAGGFYELPARLCTLDSFLDASWPTVEFEIREEDRPSSALNVQIYTGFRVVCLRAPY